jgi:ABC-type multidrug transport system fused ATPase/permease subunit
MIWNRNKESAMKKQEKQSTMNNQRLWQWLLSYAKPHMGYFFLVFIIITVITALQLYQPILIGKVIDDVITQYDKIYEEANESTIGTVEIEGQQYREIDDAQAVEDTETYAIVLSQQSHYYFVPNLTATQIQEAKEQSAEWITNGAIELNQTQLKTIRADDFKQLSRLALLYFSTLIGVMACSYIQELLMQRTGQKIIYTIRNDVFNHIESLSLRFFDTNPIGRLVTRVTGDTETLNEMYTSVLVNMGKNVFMLVGVVVTMALLNVRLSVMALAVVPILVIVTLVFRQYARKIHRNVRERVSQINAFLSEHISGMTMIQVFSQEKRKLNEFSHHNQKLKQAYMKEILAFAIYRPSMYLMYVSATAIVLFFGSKQVLDGVLTVGTVLVFVQYISKFFDPIQELAEQFNVMQSAMASTERIYSILNEVPDIRSKDGEKKLPHTVGKITFKNVWFAYEGENWVLRNVSFTVNAGETVAFVGATGAGKTSILNLISRYYDIQKGQILLDDVDIRDYKIDELRENIGQMLQDVFLFTGDIRSNIALGDTELTDTKIKEAARYVNADAFIQTLPQAYSEPVVERGATLSAGQRQLLSFARTLAYDPKVIILDEATANIDTETEQLIQQALVKLMKGRTTLVVAHRLSTIQHANRIIVLHKGEIRESGTHQELLSQKGIYYSLYELQYQ